MSPDARNDASQADPAEIDRAAAIYLVQKGIVPQKPVREAQKEQSSVRKAGGTPDPILDILRQKGALSWQKLQELKHVNFAFVVTGPDWKKQAVPGYLITRKIASGGFATIFLAKQIFTDRVMALKVLQAGKAQDKTVVMRFRNEAALLIRFKHPHIVKAYEYGMAPPGLHYIAMDFVQGDVLDQVLEKKGPFAPELAVALTRQAASALQYMQQEGYIHRDVKPQNIMLDDRGCARLFDLGLARPISEKVSTAKSDTTVGTAAYMSPEQARGEVALKAGTDIYALGLTMYAMLTGRHPFEGNDSSSTLEERFESGITAPDFSAVKAPPPVIAILQKAIHPDKLQRYRSYADLLRDLARAAGK